MHDVSFLNVTFIFSLPTAVTMMTENIIYHVLKKIHYNYVSTLLYVLISIFDIK